MAAEVQYCCCKYISLPACRADCRYNNAVCITTAMMYSFPRLPYTQVICNLYAMCCLLFTVIQQLLLSLIWIIVWHMCSTFRPSMGPRIKTTFITCSKQCCRRHAAPSVTGYALLCATFCKPALAARCVTYLCFHSPYSWCGLNVAAKNL